MPFKKGRLARYPSSGLSEVSVSEMMCMVVESSSWFMVRRDHHCAGLLGRMVRAEALGRCVCVGD